MTDMLEMKLWNREIYEQLRDTFRYWIVKEKIIARLSLVKYDPATVIHGTGNILL